MFFQRRRHKRLLWGCRINSTSIKLASSLSSDSIPNNLTSSTTTTTTTTTTTPISSRPVRPQHIMDCVDHVDIENNMKKLYSELFDKLECRQLEKLLKSLDKSKTNDLNDCVLVRRELIQGEEPHVIACRIWKYPDIQCSSELKCIPTCPSAIDQIYVCCNPNHWMRVVMEADTPPPPYYLAAMDRLRPEDRAPSEDHLGGYIGFPGSLATDGEDSSSVQGWCKLAYWELAKRVGDLVPVSKSFINITFCQTTTNDNFCISELARQRNTKAPDGVIKTRQKIGLGVTLSKDSDGTMWIYNRSSSPIFVHSPTLVDIDNTYVFVYRVPPLQCLRAYDPQKARTISSIAWPGYIAGANTGPVDIRSVRISFGKGWGPHYKRQDVSSCPCWLEVLLLPDR